MFRVVKRFVLVAVIAFCVCSNGFPCGSPPPDQNWTIGFGKYYLGFEGYEGQGTVVYYGMGRFWFSYSIHVVVFILAMLPMGLLGGLASEAERRRKLEEE